MGGIADQHQPTSRIRAGGRPIQKVVLKDRSRRRGRDRRFDSIGPSLVALQEKCLSVFRRKYRSAWGIQCSPPVSSLIVNRTNRSTLAGALHLAHDSRFIGTNLSNAAETGLARITNGVRSGHQRPHNRIEAIGAYQEIALFDAPIMQMKLNSIRHGFDAQGSGVRANRRLRNTLGQSRQKHGPKHNGTRGGRKFRPQIIEVYKVECLAVSVGTRERPQRHAGLPNHVPRPQLIQTGHGI